MSSAAKCARWSRRSYARKCSAALSSLRRCMEEEEALENGSVPCERECDAVVGEVLWGVQKEREAKVASLEAAVQRIAAEAQTQVAHVDQMMREKAAEYLRQMQDAEQRFVAQNAALRRLQATVEGLMQRLRAKGAAAAATEATNGAALAAEDAEEEV